MGIRSDVFFAHKNCVSIPEKFHDMLEQKHGAEVYLTDEGTAYSMEYTKWYMDCDTDMVEFYEFLANLNTSDFIVIEACHDYPMNTDGDAGNWYDNPWGAERFIRTGIEFNYKPNG